jgi:alkanesulfonate monooxygenase SsuD/methylene tetrahydromethanopterin reductase-like flavin-dependent oxidoreductase (luciferase family)
VDERLRAFLERFRIDMEPDAFLASREGRFLAGTVDEVAEGLRSYEAAGVERVFMQHLLHDDLDTVRLIGTELMPALA